MEDANGDNNEGELTSTMDNVTSVSSKDEKSDTSDATPTSSTDTSHFTASSHIVSDDPISSTSSDTVDQQKSKKKQNDFKTFSAEMMGVKDGDSDLLDISHMSGEKITEDVEDLVHDLESLLGEPAPSFVLPSHARSAAAKETTAVDVGQKDKGDSSEGAKSDTGSTSREQPEPDPETPNIDQVDKAADNPSVPEESIEEPATSKPNNEADIKEIHQQDLESPEPQGCDTSTESVAETNQCIQDQDITRSELKEKDDCDNLEATNKGVPPEALSSESPHEVDTTMDEADTVCKEPEASPMEDVVTVESKSSSPLALQSPEEGDVSVKVILESEEPEPAELTPKVQEIEENNVDDATCEVNNTPEDIPEATTVDHAEIIVQSPVDSLKLIEKDNGLDCNQETENEREVIEILPLDQPKTDSIITNNLEKDDTEDTSTEKPDLTEPCEVEIVKDQSDSEVVTNSEAKNHSNDITPQPIENSVEKPEVKDESNSQEIEIPAISNESESTEVSKECTEDAIPTESEEAVECTKVDETVAETVEQPMEDNIEEVTMASEKVTEQLENIEEPESIPEPETLEKSIIQTQAEIPMEISNEITEVQPVESTEVQSIESTEVQHAESNEIQSVITPEGESVENNVIQSIETTEVKSVKSTEIQSTETTEIKSVKSTEIQSAETTEVKSVESPEIQSAETTEVESVERPEIQSAETTEVESVESTEIQSVATESIAEAQCSKQSEDLEVKNDEKPLQLPISSKAPEESAPIPESSSIEAQVETDKVELISTEEESVKISTTQHIDTTPVSVFEEKIVVEERNEEISGVKAEKCVVPVQEEIEETESESSSPVNEKETEPDEVVQEDKPEVTMKTVIEEVKFDESKMEESDLPIIEPETLPNKELETDGIEIITDEVENTTNAIDPLECKSFKEPGPVNLSEESGDDEEVPTLALEPDEERKIPVKQIVPVKMDLINEAVTTTQFEDVDVQQNLETMQAVASLHGIEVQKQEESPLTEKERIEMEALSKAVESITESESDYENKNCVEAAEIEPADVEEKVFTNDSQEINEDETKDEIGVVEKASVKVSENLEKTADLRVETLQTSAITDSLLKVSDNVHIPEENVEHKEIPQHKEILQLTDGPAQKVEITTESKEKESKTEPNERRKRHKKASENKFEELSINVDVPDKEKPYSPKITIKPIKAPDEEVSTTSNTDPELAKGSLKMTITKQSDKMHSIKMGESDSNEPEQEEPVLKIKIKSKTLVETPQKMSTRSSRQTAGTSTQRSNSPRFHIKPVLKPEKEISPLKIKIGKTDEPMRKHSPKLNIKPIPKPEEEVLKEATHSPRKMMKSQKQAKPEEPEQTPKITIKPIPKPEESPAPTKLTIKPLKKPEETEMEKERSSPKIIIKPIIKPSEQETPNEERIVLKINKGNLPMAKELKHSQEDEKEEKLAKITLKISKDGGHHIVHPDESPKRPNEDSVTITEKIKRQKIDVESSIATRSKHKETVESPMETRSRHKEPIPDVTIEYKSSTIPPGSKHKDSSQTEPNIEMKRIKLRDLKQNMEQMEDDDVKIIEPKVNSPIVVSEDSHSQDSSCVIIEDNVRNTPMMVDLSMESPRSTPEVSSPHPTPKKRGRPRKVPLEIRQDFKEQPVVVPTPSPPVIVPTESGRPKRSCRSQSALDTLGLKPRKPRGPGRGRGSARGMGTRPIPMKPEKEPKVSKAKLKLMQRAAQAQLKQPRVEEAFFSQVEVVLPQIPVVEKERDVRIIETIVIDDDPTDEEQPVVVEPVVKQTKKDRKGRREEIALKRGLSRRSSLQQRESSRRSNPVVIQEKESVEDNLSLPAESATAQEEAMLITDSIALPTAASPKNTEVSKDVSNPCQEICRTPEPFEIVMVDEETRMSAETGSRAQTPAKQIAVQTADAIEESQSSVQSTATTESGKVTTPRPIKAPRLEVQEPEGAVINADQLTEYFWSGNGPYMLQEQVAQFLGIKSFKRKYPNLKRRVLDMQERDFIKENSLASEHMCDLGLTAVNSVDILDIMYSDFQDKYEEYCKHQRDRQAKDLINKQRALTLAASQERNKADILDQAMQSASQWNLTFNKARKDERRACMDLQTLTVHFPKGRVKKMDKPKVGNYPISLVPGQFTDFYEEFSPTEINNLPINTMCYNEVRRFAEDSEDSGSDGSDSDSDSSSSSMSSSSDSSSGIEDCKLCKHSPKKATVK